MFYKEKDRVFPEHPVELMNHHTLFRKMVNIESMPSKAELYMSADDYYNLSEYLWYNILKEETTSCFEVWDKRGSHSVRFRHAWASLPIVAMHEFPQILNIDNIADCKM